MAKPNIAGLFYNTTEQVEPVVGRIVRGSIPHWLQGNLFRVGPGLFDLEDDFSVNYYMDGYAIVCKFEILDGQIKYSQRLLESDAFTKATICKRPIYAEFGTRAYPDTTKNIFKRLFSLLVPTDITDNCVGNIYQFQDEIIVSAATCVVHSIHKDTLANKEKLDLSKFLPGIILLTAHPISDFDGTIWNVAISCIPTCKYHIIKIPPIGNAKQALKQATKMCTIDAIHSTSLSYVHSISMTENYVIFMEQPYQLSIIKMAQMGIKGTAIKDAFSWHPQMKNRIHVIEKATGNRFLYVTDRAYFSFNYVNSYEQDGQIVIDILTYPSPQVLENVELKKLRSNHYSQKDISQLNRFILPIIWDIEKVSEGVNLINFPNTPKALTIKKGNKLITSPQPIGHEGLQLATINSKYVGKPYLYFYGSNIYIPFGFYCNSICKVDNHTGMIKLQKTEHVNDFFGEIYFIPREDGSRQLAEDDGLIVSCVTSADAHRLDYLLVLDGQSFEIISKIEFDVKFPQSLNGCFLKK